jgi:A/G-specific adenine glycosylase
MKGKKVSDTEIEKILKEVLPKGRAREWYSALMDYGAFLKRSGISHNTKSKTYTKQSKFAGSLREARGTIIRAHTRGVTSHAKLVNLLGPARKEQMEEALEALISESLLSVPQRGRQRPQ